MKISGKILLVFLAFASLQSFKWAQQVDGWVYEQEKKGIKVFTKKGKWGQLRDSKAVMTVNNTPEQMLAFLTDFDHYNTWFARCQKSKLLARIGDNEYIVYLFFDAPWPASDRDCVIRVKVVKDDTTGAITVTQTSEPKYVKEEANVVRVQQLVSTWKLVPTSTGTLVTNEYASNPGGNVPDWMVNTQSVETPMTTFQNLQQKAVTAKH